MNTPTNDTQTAPAGDSETIRKVYVKDLREKDVVQTVFRVGKKARIAGRSGKSFVTLTLVDKTGEVDGRIFDRVDELEPGFSADDYVLVKGSVILFHSKTQVLVDAIERLDPEPIDAKEYAFEPPAKPAPVESSSPQAAPASERTHGGHESSPRAVAHIREMLERVMDPNVRALLLAFLDDPEFGPGLASAPAAKGIHHAYKGGMADHILSVMKLAHRVADHYPTADRDLLLAGAFLHDIGKVRELSFERGNFDYTDEGRLVGHLVITAQKIREIAKALPHFPPLLEQHLTHLVLAHHGQLEYGSPKLPVTLEALLVHLIDLMDSRVASWLEIMARDPNDKWTDVSRLYERHLWKGPTPTIRNKGPVEPRHRRNKDEPRRGRGNKERSTEPNKPVVEAKGPRRERPAKTEAKASGLPGELMFKPFNALAPPSEDVPAAGQSQETDTKNEQ